MEWVIYINSPTNSLLLIQLPLHNYKLSENLVGIYYESTSCIITQFSCMNIYSAEMVI